MKTVVDYSATTQKNSISLEWQVFRDTENTEKLGTKEKIQKIAEYSILATENKKYLNKLLSLEYFKTEFNISHLLSCSKD